MRRSTIVRCGSRALQWAAGAASLLLGGVAIVGASLAGIVTGDDRDGGLVALPLGIAVGVAGVAVVRWVHRNGLELTESVVRVHLSGQDPEPLDPTTVVFLVPDEPGSISQQAKYRVGSRPWEPVPLVGQGQFRTPRRLRGLERDLVDRGFRVLRG